MQQSGQISPDGYWMWNGVQWVPNPQGAYPTAMPVRPYESPRLRAQLTGALLVSNVVGLLLLIVFDVTDAAYNQTVNPGDALAMADFLTAAAGVVVFYTTLIVAIVFFCMWLHRTVRNMPALGSPDPRWSPARSVVYCFIPILNLFHPFLSIQDSWRGADPARRWMDLAARKAARTAPTLGVWWALWLIGGFLSRISARIDGVPGDLVDLVSNVMLIVAAVLAILVVRDVTNRQERKQALIASGQLV